MPTPCPIPGATGTLEPEGTGSIGVLLLGEAMGDEEVEDGLPFRPWGQAGSVLQRAIRRAGMTREEFVLWNVVPAHPPKNYLDGAPWEAAAISWGLPYLEAVIEKFKPRCIVALGNIATRVSTGLTGDKLGVSYLTGYVLPSRFGIPVVPCFHPSFLRRGKMSHFGVLLRALRLAVQVAQEGSQPTTPTPEAPPPGYRMTPTEDIARGYVDAARSGAWSYLAYDIETPYSNKEDEAEEHAGNIISIQFSLSPGTGIYLPWRLPFIDIAKAALATRIPKLSWNGWRFDDPRLRAEGCTIEGLSHDLMWAWHHTQPDIPRNLQFAAAHQGLNIYDPATRWPWPWKHLDSAHPQFYGIVDVDVLQWMVA